MTIEEALRKADTYSDLLGVGGEENMLAENINFLIECATLLGYDIWAKRYLHIVESELMIEWTAHAIKVNEDNEITGVTESFISGGHGNQIRAYQAAFIGMVEKIEKEKEKR